MCTKKKKKRKDYLKLFVKFCRDNDIWWAVCTSGQLDQYTIFLDDGSDVTGDFCTANIGTKKAYDFIVREVAEIKQNNADETIADFASNGYIA